MIAQTLNRDWLLGCAAAAAAGLEDVVATRERRGGAPTPLDDFDETELQELAVALKTLSEQREQLEDAGHPVNRPERELPKDDFAYVPRDPLLSIVQSAIDEHFEVSEPDAIVVAPLLDDRRSGEEPVVTDRQIKDAPLRRSPEGRRVWGQMEVTRPKIFSDPRWALSAVAMAYRLFKKRARFNATPPRPIEIANQARVLLVGDWGSGLPRADKVAGQMRQVLKDGRRERRQQCVVHLGDVYYSGWKREYETRFLDTWPVAPHEKDVRSFALNGNHDMYTGGHAYYETCLGDRRFSAQRSCSFFALRNDHWQLLGLDTAYEDGGLHGDQAGWAMEMLDSAPRLKTGLLSHHQLFSAHEPGANKLRTKIARVVGTGGVDAWFWGHEHRCIVYGPHEGVRFSTCVGHGGIPEYLILRENQPLPQPAVYEYRKVYGSGIEPWDTFGFGVVDLDGDKMSVDYIDEDGNRHHNVPNVLAEH